MLLKLLPGTCNPQTAPLLNPWHLPAPHIAPWCSNSPPMACQYHSLVDEAPQNAP